MPRHKVRNQRRVYEFWLEHQNGKNRKSMASVGRTFHISRAWVSQIVKKFRELEDATETPPKEL